MTGELRPRSPQPPDDYPQQRLNPRVTEASFQTGVIAALQQHRFVVCHFRPGRTRDGDVLTAIEGDRGCPDLILSRDGHVWLIELKTDQRSSKPTADQSRWLAEAGPMGTVWRPADWPWMQWWMKHPVMLVHPAPPGMEAG